MNLSALKLTENLNNVSSDELSIESIPNYKTCLYDDSCRNEIQISNLIKNELNDTSHYNIIHNHEFIHVRDMNQERVASHENLNYVLLQYHLDTSDYKPLSDFLTRIELPHRFFSSMFKIYCNLLTCLQELDQMDICFFDLRAENILVDKDCNVILNDLKLSLLCNNNNKLEYLLEKSVENLTHYTLKPIEIHLMHYLVKINSNPLSYSSIDEIATHYIENMIFLNYFDKDFKTYYYRDCVAYLKKKYLHQCKEDIFKIVRENWKTWDNFALSVLFLHIFENVTQCFSLNKTILSEIIVLLKQNLNANPTSRTTISSTKTEIDKLFHENKDWSFLHLIPKSKMKKLYELL